MSSQAEDSNIWDFIDFQGIGLDANELSAINAYFGKAADDDDEERHSNRGVLPEQPSIEQPSTEQGLAVTFSVEQDLVAEGFIEQHPLNPHPPTGGKTISALISAGFLNEDNDEHDPNESDIALGTEVATAEQTTNAQDEGYGSQQILDTVNARVFLDSAAEEVVEPEETIPEEWNHFTTYHSIAFDKLDNYGQQCVVLGYVEDNPKWFSNAIAANDINFQCLLKLHPEEVVNFLKDNREEPQLKDVFARCARLLENPEKALDNVDEEENLLIKLLTQHKDDDTLSKIFDKHPIILAHALKSIDNPDVLLKFFDKHKSVVADWLKRHKNIGVLADFFDKYPAAVNMILDEERAIIENFLRAVPEALYTYLDANPKVLKDYFSTRPEEFQSNLRALTTGEPSSHRHAKDLGKRTASITNKNKANAANTYVPRPENSQSRGIDSLARPQRSTKPYYKSYHQKSPRPEDKSITSGSLIMGNQQSVPSASSAGRKVQITAGFNPGYHYSTENNTVGHGIYYINQPNYPHVKPVESLRTTAGHDDDWAQIAAEREIGNKYSSKAVNHGFEVRFEEVSSENESEPELEPELAPESEIEDDDDNDDDFAPFVANPIEINDSDDEIPETSSSDDNDEDYSEFLPQQKTSKAKKPAPARRAATTMKKRAAVNKKKGTNIPKKKKALSQKEKNMRKAPKSKPTPWTQVEQDSVIKHMLAIRDEGIIDTEERFEETAARLNAELGVARTKTGVKNFWARTGRAASGYDERKKWNRTEALATSLQGKKRKRAVKKEEEDDEEEEAEEGDFSDECRAIANGTRQKKRVKYTS